ncbi:MAG: PP0621 family protein [Alcanivoracaceae bacterium]|jgi:uncharacterized protein|nr:PP0621 family protein [Alcanivoracaceae bacterium]
MGLFRLLLIIALVWLAWRLLKKTLLSGQGNERRDNLDAPHRMVRCARCGLHVPESDSVEDQGNHFCSQAHLKAWHEENDTDRN